LFGLFDDVLPLIEFSKATRPDLVFNLCESFNSCRELEPNLIAVFELLGIKYTGASSEALQLCKDKGMTKKILTYHKLAVPRFQSFQKGTPIELDTDLVFPCIVKPLAMEASEGIAMNSKVATADECIERIEFLWRKFTPQVIVEEFIFGRELYVGILGNRELEVFPPQELFIKSKKKGTPTFLTYKGKWDKKYRKRWGIDSATAEFIEPTVLAEISRVSTEIYQILRLRGYARLDLRLRENGTVVFLEANPNPSISKTDDFAQGAQQVGLVYEDLVERITRLALAS
jgi:D-alanine-D-alanine ligase